MKSIYLDWAASAPINPDLPAFILKALLNFQGNPSSVHTEGKNARNQINNSRKVCANLLGTKPEQLIFTSGGTDSNSIIVSSLFRKKSKGQIIISAIEHPSIYVFSAALKDSGFDVIYITPDSDGFIDPNDLKLLLKPSTIFVSIMTVNNETGAIQPLETLISVIRDFEQKNGRSIHIHTDAVQALGKIPFKPGLFDIDSASFSAHKIGGPKGTGLLYLKKPIAVLSSGGGQEFAIRPGTENTAGIIAFSKAMETSIKKLENNMQHAEYLKSLLTTEFAAIEGVRILFSSANEDNLSYSPYIISATVSPVPGEVLVRVLSDKGVFISTGSACSSRNRKKQIRVLVSSGASEKDASGSIRISTGWSTTEADIIDFCAILKPALSELRKYLR
ncbi:MAG: cysteine desulfurase [Spirochaetales bacterium]|nr:cysteine desulfurase [Spirochaetales bacterium]